MNANTLVFWLLSEDEEYTPEGYRLLDTARVGDYFLKLWQTEAHIKGEPYTFNEISLNAVGHRFDAEGQRTKFKGSSAALGHRAEFLRTVVRWIKEYGGNFYIGSHIPAKLQVYHRMFKQYLPQLIISEPFAAFDECEGDPEYFSVKTRESQDAPAPAASADVRALTGHAGVMDSLLDETEEDADVQRYVNELPSVVDRASVEATKLFKQHAALGLVNRENYSEWAESVVEEAVDNLRLTSDDQVVDIDLFNTVLQNVLTYADQSFPES